MKDTDDVVFEEEDGDGNTKTPTEKLRELREKLSKTQKERDEYLDSLQRMKADYINAKKRFEDERKSIGSYATETVVLELIPVLDSLDSALLHDPNMNGIQSIKNQLEKILESYGVTSFDPKGAAFDPNLHESVEILAVADESEDNIVTRVHQRGYSLNGRTIRPARVAVAHYQK